MPRGTGSLGARSAAAHRNKHCLWGSLRPSLPPQPPSTTSAARGAIQPGGTALFAKSKLPVTYYRRLRLRSRNAPRFVHSLPNRNDSRKNYPCLLPALGSHLLLITLTKAATPCFQSVPGKRCLFWKNMKLSCSVLENQQKFSSL